MAALVATVWASKSQSIAQLLKPRLPQLRCCDWLASVTLMPARLVLQAPPEVADIREFESAEPIDGPEAQEDTPEVEESGPQSTRVFLVRVPRPPIDAADAQTKKLTQEFQTHLEKIKKMNAKLAAKRVRLCTI